MPYEITIYKVTVGRKDLRWLNAEGKEVKKRGRKAYIFRSAITDKVQRLLDKNGFEGSYIRHLNTGRSVTNWLNLSMLCLAEKHNGIVSMTLEGFLKDYFAKSIVGLPVGRLLYDLLETPGVFSVSTDEGVVLPDYNDFYDNGFWKAKPFGGQKFIPDKRDEETYKQAERIKKNVYIELNPEFVAGLGSVDLSSGPIILDKIRSMFTKAKTK